MRWDNLFDDLEGQLENEREAEEVDLRAEEERLRLGRLSVRDRILAVHDAHSRHAPYAIQLELADGHPVRVRPTTIGRDWFSADLLGDGPAAQCVVPFSAIAAVFFTRSQLAQSLVPPVRPETAATLSARLGLGFVLRDLCRRRATVDLRLTRSQLFGTIDRVGRDHFDLAVHEAGSARRESAVSQYRVVSFDQVVFLRV
ncbi:MAG: hypothetical protein H7146_13440 [Burkholderiaceae bacterium]|nr:hypothetical protein [Microbacteriaceae bacterium]